MTSTAFIDGSLPDQAAGATRGIVFAGGWAVEYDWVADRTTATGQPRRLSALSFPAPFDTDIEGALRGRGDFGDFLYVFKNGQYVRLIQSTMAVDGGPTDTAGAWDLPADWTEFDAVLPGRGAKINFAYFFRGTQYTRFDWTTNKRSPGYPKFIAQEWHTTPPFVEDFDGVVVGQAGNFTNKAYLFKTLPATVNGDGNAVPAGTPGSFSVFTPGYIRYDFNLEQSEGSETNPAQVVANWPGLLPLLDAGRAIDIALKWCDDAVAGLQQPLSGVAQAALQAHFRTAAPTDAQLTSIRTRMSAVRNRINTIPDRFQWTRGLAETAQTVPNSLTEIGDGFTLKNGPNGRAAIMIHEAMHFTSPGGPEVDIPEWSGETVHGQAFGIDAISNRAYSSLTTDEAMTNPSSYAALAQQISLGADERFGAARPHE